MDFSALFVFTASPPYSSPSCEWQVQIACLREMSKETAIAWGYGQWLIYSVVTTDVRPWVRARKELDLERKEKIINLFCFLSSGGDKLYHYRFGFFHRLNLFSDTFDIIGIIYWSFVTCIRESFLTLMQLVRLLIAIHLARDNRVWQWIHPYRVRITPASPPSTHTHTLIRTCQSHVLSLPLQVKWFLRHCGRCSCQHQLRFSVYRVIKLTVAIFHACSSLAVVCISNQLIYSSSDSSGRKKCSRG